MNPIFVRHIPFEGRIHLSRYVSTGMEAYSLCDIASLRSGYVDRVSQSFLELEKLFGSNEYCATCLSRAIEGGQNKPLYRWEKVQCIHGSGSGPWYIARERVLGYLVIINIKTEKCLDQWEIVYDHGFESSSDATVQFLSLRSEFEIENEGPLFEQYRKSLYADSWGDPEGVQPKIGDLFYQGYVSTFHRDGKKPQGISRCRVVGVDGFTVYYEYDFSGSKERDQITIAGFQKCVESFQQNIRGPILDQSDSARRERYRHGWKE